MVYTHLSVTLEAGCQRNLIFAVLVPGVGAVCCAKDPEDLWAIQMIMRKSAMAALYAQACSAAPLSPVDRRIMRFVYTMKYAKKKTEQ